MSYSTNWSNFIAWLLLPLEISDVIPIIIACYPVCEVINFEIFPSLSYQAVFLHDQNVMKNLNISRTKGF